MSEKDRPDSRAYKAAKIIETMMTPEETTDALKFWDDSVDGKHKFATLGDAAFYAALCGDRQMSAFLSEKNLAAQALATELARENAASGGALVPGMPLDDENGHADALIVASHTMSNLHPKLAQIAELEKLRFLVGEQNHVGTSQ